VSSRTEHDYALLLHAAEIEKVGDTRFRCFGEDLDRVDPEDGRPVKEGPLSVSCACDRPADCAIEIGSLVLSYTSGVTQVKGGAKLRGDMKGYSAPVDRRIVCRPAVRGCAARFFTLIGTADPTLTVQEDVVEVRVGKAATRMRVTDDELKREG